MSCVYRPPPLFAADVTDLRATIVKTIESFDSHFQTLIEPWQALSAEERGAIDAETSIAAIASAWEANGEALRSLLLPVPPITRALPRFASDGHNCTSDQSFGSSSSSSSSRKDEDDNGGSTYSSGEMILAHLARDWSSHGAVARAATHRPVLRHLDSLQRRARSGQPLRILVPGSGACRLAWEMARRGHRVEANDASTTMLLAARAMIALISHGALASHRAHADLEVSPPLRIVPRAGCAGGIAPRERTCLNSAFVPEAGLWKAGGGAHRSHHSHGLRAGRTQRSWRRPMLSCDEVNAVSERLTLQPGAWSSSYASEQFNASFDALVTCYFIDTLGDPASAIRHARRLLRPGGHWLNVGPLLWHDAAGRLRLSMDEIIALLRLGGFELTSAPSHLGAVPYLSSEPTASSHGLTKTVWRRALSALSTWSWRGSGRAGRRGSAAAVDGDEVERHDVVFWVARLVR